VTTDAPATVLVVEDETALRQVLQRALQRQGYRVLAAASAETGYELLGSERADAVLLDVRLPVMSGLALYLALLHRSPSLEGRMAIMTGDAEADGVRAWLERNPCTVLQKPFDLQAILRWVKSVVDPPGAQRENG
jgi:DNA-binding NtrC family response regulator